MRYEHIYDGRIRRPPLPLGARIRTQYDTMDFRSIDNRIPDTVFPSEDYRDPEYIAERIRQSAVSD